MDMAHEESALRRFWRAWRRDIVRGGLLFTAVLAIGLGVRHAMGRAGDTIRGLANEFGPELGALIAGFEDNRGGASAETFHWAGRLAPGNSVWLRNTNGAITVDGHGGDSLVVTATKQWRRSDSGLAHVMVVPHAGGITFCAVWKARDAGCGERGSYRLHGITRNDVSVSFHVRLPRRVRVDASTINGNVRVWGATAAVVARSVNGQIGTTTSRGPVEAVTVNGSVDATVEALAESAGIELRSVNGSITATLPRVLNAQLEARTENGRVETDFPLTVSGRLNPRRVTAMIGAGGPLLEFRTVNGSVRLKQMGWAETPPPPPRTPARR